MTSHSQTHPSHTDIQQLLNHIKKHIYHDIPAKRYSQDRTMLIYTLTWPATWLQNKNLNMPKHQYNNTIINKIKNIQQHGDPKQYKPYFPRYLLKTLQDHYHHNEDKLYYTLTHAANPISTIITSIQNTTNTPYLNILAQTHRIIKAQKTNHPKNKNPQQMTLNI